MARCHELLRGAIDLHTHSAPSFFDRLLDDVGLAEQARAAGMRAVLYKAHEQDTTGRAALVRRAVPGIQAFGGVVLNHAVGGLNPAAVDASIKLGARMVWMPTMSAQHHVGFFGGSHFGPRMPARPSAPAGSPGGPAVGGASTPGPATTAAGPGRPAPLELSARILSDQFAGFRPTGAKCGGDANRVAHGINTKKLIHSERSTSEVLLGRHYR
jgi:hypothetical protein